MFVGQNNAGIKAREYLESLGYDGVNNGGEEYIAFYSNQAKNADNLNPTENEDIRYSKDVDSFNPKGYNEIKVSQSEYRAISNALVQRLHSNEELDEYQNISIFNTQRGIDYKYMIRYKSFDDFKVIGKERIGNIHDKKEIGNVDRKAEDISSRLEVSERRHRIDRNSDSLRQDGRTTRGNDGDVSGEVSTERRSDGTGYAKNGNNADLRGKRKSRDVDATDYKSLVKENSKLKEINEFLKQELVPGHHTSKSRLISVARQVKKVDIFQQGM